MAGSFHFVPRSVRNKSSKAEQIFRSKPRNIQSTSGNIHGSCSSAFVGDQREVNNKKPPEAPTATNVCRDIIGQSSKHSVTESTSIPQNESESDDDGSNVVYFSKNQRWPQNGEPICVVCGRYGEFICDQTEDDVCSKECKAKNLRLRQDANRQKGEESYTYGEGCKNKISPTHGDCLPHDTEKYEYIVHPKIASLTETQVDELRTHMEITIKGDNCERPILEFSQCGMNKQLSDNLSKCGYVTPTPVQMQVIPVALAGHDLLACAQTGSGKTAAFLIPMITQIHHIIASRQKHSHSSFTPQGLILSPTRELCMQIESQAKELMAELPYMKTALIVGGMPIPSQLYRLQQGVQVVFATPGRLAEILSKDVVDFSDIQMLVIDEVDVLMKMGFENQVQSILKAMPIRRQTLLFSATIPPSMERISSTLLTNPVWISVGAPSSPNMDVKQVIIWVEDKSKKKRLFSLLKDSKYFTPPILVFVDSRLGADMLSEAVQKTCNVRCTSMHGEKVQSERTQILTAFLSGKYDVLVCTGVLGRGLDLRCVKQVVNFDMPSSVDEYIHQVGRAGRLGSKGLALTFINNTNKAVFLDLVEAVQPHGVKLPDELLNSPYLSSQQHERECKRKNRKRKYEELYVNTENLMDILKKRTFRRRLKDR